MSAENDHAEGSRGEASKRPSFDWGTPDELLSLFVDSANSGAQLPITLTIGGALISGLLVGGRTWFDGVAGFIETSTRGSPEAAQGLARGLRKWAEEFYPDSGDEDDQFEDPPMYIHLQEAKVFHPGSHPIPGLVGTWWRGRLTAVDGFVIGQLGERETE